MIPSIAFVLVTVVIAGLCAGPALAVRPFVTDDARIADRGQIEAETWLTVTPTSGSAEVIYNVLLNVVPNDWIEIAASGGIGYDPEESTSVANPALQGKVLFWQPPGAFHPGLALAAGVVLPYGRGGAYRDAIGSYVVAPATLSFFRDDLFIHGNLGVTMASDVNHPLFARVFWGIGTDAALWRSDWRVIAEAFAGDPFDALGPSYAGQAGFRWLINDHVNVDLSMILAPEIDERRRNTGRVDWGAQLGLRVLFDVFTPGGRPGDPAGAPGLFRPSPFARAESAL
jgi:hypothetical protein